MRAIEALERLIAMGDGVCNEELLKMTVGEELPQPLQDNLTAVAICQAMVNTAIPIARFRIHAEIRNVGRKSKLGECDFTICGSTIAAVKAGILGLKDEDAETYVSLWEQRPNGADMLSGYQGPIKSQRFRAWLKQIDYFQTEPTVQ